MKDIKEFNQWKGKLICIAVLLVVGVTFWSMINFVLFTFIFAFVFYKLLRVIQKSLKKKNIKGRGSVTIPDGCIIAVLYAVFATILVMICYKVVPILIMQMTDLANLFMSFDVKSIESTVDPRLYSVIKDLDFNKYIEQVAVLITTTASTIGSFGLDIFLSFILSLLILLEKDTIQKFGQRLKSSKISFMYDYLVTFGGSFVNTFGKVMMVQVTIALVNAILSMAMLYILGFPKILVLGSMIFLLGLIPVAGVIISLIPLSIIAFSIGGIIRVIAVFVMVMVIHTIEAYILNPKLMANKTKLPVCLVFIILLIGEHYLGVWGLLIGLPIFIFLLDMLDVKCS